MCVWGPSAVGKGVGKTIAWTKPYNQKLMLAQNEIKQFCATIWGYEAREAGKVQIMVPL